MSFFHSYLEAAAPYAQDYGYPAVFIALFLESFGLPLPGETLLIAGAFMASRGKLDLTTLLLVAWVAAVLGDNVGYAIGHFGGRRLVLRFGGKVGLTDAHLQRVESFFRRFGGEVVILARFVTVARQLNGIVAGTAGMSWWRFLPYNALGAALWVGFWGMGIYAFGNALTRLAPWLNGIGIVVAIIIVLVLAAMLLHRVLRRRS